MTSFFIFAALFSIAPSSISYYLEPQTLFEMGLFDHEPPPCRKLTRAERQQREISPVYKATTYSLEGMAICKRSLFPYGFRDSFFDYLTKHSRTRARKAAAHVKATLFEQDKSISVAVHSPRSNWSYYVRSVFIQELSAALGSQRIYRSPDAPADYTLDVMVRKIQDPIEAYDIRLIPQNPALGGS